MKRYGFIGMGSMGAPMAANLAKNGLEITVWNRSPSKASIQNVKDAGCKVASTISSAVSGADIIFTCVSDVPDVDEILFSPSGIAENGNRNALVVEMSTIGPQAAKSFAERLNKQGFRFLDAPITGGDTGAKVGTLTFMVGGSPEDFEEAQPALKAMGKIIKHCGPVGSGQALKLVNQVFVAIHMVALSEAFTLADALEVDLNSVIDICGTGAAGSWALSNLGPRIKDADFEPGFMIQHICKDLKLIRQSFPDKNNLPGLNLADKLFVMAAKNFTGGIGGKKGTQAMIQAYAKKNIDFKR